MRLTKVVISGFRSIKGEVLLLIDGRTTVLVGANDHGKSNVLEAIRCLNDEHPLTDDDRNWDLDGKDAGPSVSWHFALEDQEVQELDAIAKDALDKLDPAAVVQLPRNDSELVFCRKGPGTPVQVAGVPGWTPAECEPQILGLRPRVELFEAPAANLQDYTTRSALESDLVMQGIFRMAGLWDSRETIFSKTSVTSKKLDLASKQLTEALRDRWNQGKDLEWKLSHNGDRVELEIMDPSIDSRYSRPSQRSSGFRTYFLLSMMTSARTAGSPAASYIFLFDEPSTYLHPHAQIDLQRSFEKIAERSQVMYSTHSLFLINKNHPNRNKLVSKGADGTRIDQKPFRRNWKALRDSLGILFNSNFLIADKTLLVEGPSDVVYILAAINQLKRAGKADIDLNDLSVVDAGSSENYVAMAKLMLSEGRSVVALVDGDKAGRDYETRLKRACAKEFKDKALSFVELPEGKSAEDLFADLGAFQAAARGVAETLVAEGDRAFADPVPDLQQEVRRLSPSDKETLGRTLDLVSPEWFSPRDKLSKLSVALRYEEVTKEVPITFGDEAVVLVSKIKKLLGVRGETAAEEGVFEEA